MFCAIYELNNDLLDLSVWKLFKGIARRQKKLLRMAKQAKLRSYWHPPKYMYGFEFPRDYQHALHLDDSNGNHRRREATSIEMEALLSHNAFNDLGMNSKVPDR